jgi:hypothetical protein
MPLQQPTLEASTATLVAHAMYAEILRVGHTCMMRLQQSYKALQGGRKYTVFGSKKQKRSLVSSARRASAADDSCQATVPSHSSA